MVSWLALQYYLKKRIRDRTMQPSVHWSDVLTATRTETTKLLVRVTVGTLILFHTWAVIHGELAIRETLMRWNLPVELLWTSLLFEGLAPILVIIGVYARIGALLMTFWMVMAFLLAHIDTGHLTELNATQNAWRVEGPFFFLILSLVVALQGAGRYSLNIGGKWN
jgi:putative oxidoreductase